MATVLDGAAIAAAIRQEVAEGVRALLIDKDQKPRWQPSGLADIDAAAVEAYFAPLGAQDLKF